MADQLGDHLRSTGQAALGHHGVQLDQAFRRRADAEAGEGRRALAFVRRWRFRQFNSPSALRLAARGALRCGSAAFHRFERPRAVLLGGRSVGSDLRRGEGRLRAEARTWNEWSWPARGVPGRWRNGGGLVREPGASAREAAWQGPGRAGGASAGAAARTGRRRPPGLCCRRCSVTSARRFAAARAALAGAEDVEGRSTLPAIASCSANARPRPIQLSAAPWRWRGTIRRSCSTWPRSPASWAMWMRPNEPTTGLSPSRRPCGRPIATGPNCAASRLPTITSAYSGEFSTKTRRGRARSSWPMRSARNSKTSWTMRRHSRPTRAARPCGERTCAIRSWTTSARSRRSPASSTRPIARPPGRSPASPGPIFILGMPRTGSTLLERKLAGHPDIEPLGELQTFGQTLVEAVRRHAAGPLSSRTALIEASASGRAGRIRPGLSPGRSAP